MNPLESSALIGALMAAWPWAEWPDATVELYNVALAPHDVEIARDAVEHLIRTERRPPSIAGLLEEITTRRRGMVRDNRALPGPRERLASREFSQEWIARIRKQLADARGPLAGGLGRSLPKDRAG